MNDDAAEKLTAILDQMERGYDVYLSQSRYESEEAYQTDLRYAGYYQEYGDLSYEKIKDKIYIMPEGEEREWLKA